MLFHAQSGAGKTSLLQASVAPSLAAQKRVRVLPISRVGGDLPPGVSGEAVSNLYVFNALLNLRGKAAQPSEIVGLTLMEGLRPFFEQEETERRLRPRLLILDQFEELFTTHPERYRERADFFRQVQEALAAFPQLSLLLSMREDFIAHLDSYAAQLPDRLRTRFRMERLTRDGALAAVREPAAQHGRPFDAGVAETLVDNLRRIQVREVEPRGAAGDSPNGADGASENGRALGTYVEPVHLQIVCRQLWASLPPDDRRIEAADVQAFGDVDQALRDFYEEALAKAEAATGIPQRRLRAWFEEELITPARTRGLVYRGERETAGLRNDAATVLLNAYLIRADTRGGDVWYELAHDRLVEPILDANLRWQASYTNPLAAPARAWLQAGRDPARLLTGAPLAEAQGYAEAHPEDLLAEERQFLEESTREAARAAQEARQATRRRRNAVVALLAALALMSGLTLWALASRTEAEEQARAAATAQKRAEFGEAEAALQATVANEARGTAVAESTVAAEERGRAEQQAELAATQEARAEDAAEQAEREAVRAQSQAHAAEALYEVSQNNGDRALLLTLAAVEPLTQTKPVVVARTLREVVDNTLIRHILRRHMGEVFSMAWSPDGQQLATASSDGTARVWQTTGEAVSVLVGHTDRVFSVAWSPDGQQVLTGSCGWHGARLGCGHGAAHERPGGPHRLREVGGVEPGWAAGAHRQRGWHRPRVGCGHGQTMSVLEGHTANVLAVAWSPDGQQVLTAQAMARRACGRRPGRR